MVIATPLGNIGPGDQLQEVLRPDATEDELGAERWEIREALKGGEVNEQEARDMLALSGYALSNPDPLEFGPEFGPLDTIANAGLALLGEFVSDPLSAPAIIATGGGALARPAIASSLRSINRTVAKRIATEVGEEGYQSALSQMTKATEDLAAQKLAGGGYARYMPKSATAAAKGGQRIQPGDISDMDRLDAVLDMGADTAHPWSAAIREGVEGMGTLGHVAVKAPRIIKTAQAIDRMVDPFSLFGYWKTGALVPAVMSKEASHGAIDAIGWRVIRRLDGALAEAGVPPRRSTARATSPSPTTPCRQATRPTRAGR